MLTVVISNPIICCITSVVQCPTLPVFAIQKKKRECSTERAVMLPDRFNSTTLINDQMTTKEIIRAEWGLIHIHLHCTPSDDDILAGN